ncbi:DoxX family protein [Streptomyces sp. PvR006]|uniref:DoxX family protein n=1 Tax=Streptomyces sp. PvR006 TaxID=2817860 RepID=UPI0027DB274A|nr:DoxX family protein [Streptomyces sp. PvR006]
MEGAGPLPCHPPSRRATTSHGSPPHAALRGTPRPVRGAPTLVDPLAVAKLAGAAGLLIGSALPVVGLLAGAALVLDFLGAVVTVLRPVPTRPSLSPCSIRLRSRPPLPWASLPDTRTTRLGPRRYEASDTRAASSNVRLPDNAPRTTGPSLRRSPACPVVHHIRKRTRCALSRSCPWLPPPWPLS